MAERRDCVPAPTAKRSVMSASANVSAFEILPSGFDNPTGLAANLSVKIADARRAAELKVGCALAIDRVEPQEANGRTVLRVFWRKA